MKMQVKDRIPFSLSIDYFQKDELQEAFKKPKFIDLVYHETFESIRYAIKHQKKNAPIFEVNETGTFITINAFEYENSLNSILKYFEKTEQYEMCIKVNNLLKSL